MQFLFLNLVQKNFLKDIWIYEDIVKVDFREFVCFT